MNKLIIILLIILGLLIIVMNLPKEEVKPIQEASWSNIA
jgi:hypothetical protein